MCRELLKHHTDVADFRWLSPSKASILLGRSKQHCLSSQDVAVQGLAHMPHRSRCRSVHNMQLCLLEPSGLMASSQLIWHELAAASILCNQ